MAVTAKRTVEPRWTRTFHEPDTLADDLGTIGAWVGPRTGPNKRTQGQKEDYIFRRLLVAWKESGRLSFPITVRATADEGYEPDYVLEKPDGTTLGVEITEAGEENYQAWLTSIERQPTGGQRAHLVPFEPLEQEVADQIRSAIEAKISKFDRGWYRGPTDCHLVVYDNTAWGGFMDIDEIINLIKEPNKLSDRFSQIHLVSSERVFISIFGNDPEKIDVRRAYEIDYAAWIFDQVERLRASKRDDLDLAHIAEELEDLGKSERRALGSHLRNLMLHLLKWRYQPRKRSKSWRVSIYNSRIEICELLCENPSMRPDFKKQVLSQYSRARSLAAIETELDLDVFPEECPFSREQLLDPEYLD